ncbi:MAG TPA: helix-turn-helix domain-containing protein [Nocardioidaceae bacterium]|nr:helix-turn-helix domain-containing protein [Nocardioidaceae bacterium]
MTRQFPSPMAVLGIDGAGEQLYRVALRNAGASPRTLAEKLGCPLEQVATGLAKLDALGLVDVDGDEVHTVSPDQGVERLIATEARRLASVSAQLESVRATLPSLMAEHWAAQAPQGRPVTVEAVEGGDVLGLIRALSATSEGDLMWIRPDQWRFSAGQETDTWVKHLVASGRKSRAIYPARVFEEAPDVVRSRAEVGEHVRVLAEVPSRVAIMGTSAVLVPEMWGKNTGRRLVVRQPAIIAAFTMLFEALWERAMAIPGLGGPMHTDDRSNDRRLLLDQLANGAKDEQIARTLGISLRTVRRRVADILDELGVNSRFQAGVEAVRRGWV